MLARVAPSSEELIYCHHDRGFALHSMRSPEVTRLYLQCAPDEDIGDWPDERDLGGAAPAPAPDGWRSTRAGAREGRHPMRSFVAEPMQHGRLYLAGDAAHIVPPTGAKGLNLAVADVRVLAAGARALVRAGDGLAAARLLGHLPAPRLARAVLLLVDDLDVPSDARRTTASRRGSSALSSPTSAPRGPRHVARGELRGRRGRPRLNPGKTNCLMYSVGFRRPSR